MQSWVKRIHKFSASQRDVSSWEVLQETVFLNAAATRSNPSMSRPVGTNDVAWGDVTNDFMVGLYESSRWDGKAGD